MERAISMLHNMEKIVEITFEYMRSKLVTLYALDYTILVLSKILNPFCSTSN